MTKDKFGETCKRHEIQSSSIEDVNFHIKNICHRNEPIT